MQRHGRTSFGGKLFLPAWNGVEIIQNVPIPSDVLRLYTDASDLGFGAVYKRSWIISEWKHGWGDQHINVRELFAIWVALHTWGGQWSNMQILFLTDSQSMSQVWRTGTSRDKVVMRIIRAMFMFCAKHNINLLMKHIPGKSNILADHLSRFQVKEFTEAMPEADPVPTVFNIMVWKI